MKIYAITNVKGGSGKTTTAVNLAAVLGEMAVRTLVIDLDQQASATEWLGAKGDTGAGLLEALTAGSGLDELVRTSTAAGVDVIPSGAQMTRAEKRLADALEDLGADTTLRDTLAGLEAGRWDVVLLDCPPTPERVTANALVAANAVLAPVEAHKIAARGTDALTATLERVRSRVNPGLRLAGILAVRVDGRSRHSAEVVEQLRKKFGTAVFETVVRKSVRLADAFAFCEPITIHDHKGRGAEDYRAVAAEFLKREGIQ